jgi:hypothetical protein
MFSQAQCQAVITKINQATDDLAAKIAEVPRTANTALSNPSLPPEVRDAIVWVAQKITDLATQFLQRVKELMEGAAAPVAFFQLGLGWQDVRGAASGIAGQLKPEMMPAATSWSGSAAAAYTRAIRPQGDATARIVTVSDKAALSLNSCAVAGIAFYVALGIILVKFIAAMVAAIAAFGSGVFSPAGAALVVEEAAVNTGLIIAAVSALTALLTAQAGAMVALHGEAVDNSTFPGGHWPSPISGGRYDDASVASGHANWSLNR